MEKLIGQTLGRYKLTKLLGEGGMGAVFKATDVTLQRDVAVKIMHPHTAKQPNFRERFLQEARTAARLDHPSIVKVYDFGQERGLLYIVMEYIAGANLRSMLEDMKKERKWLPLQESILIMQHICMAMDYAHHQGVLHRDLKPSNVMIEPEPADDLPYRPVLTDLGLARLMQADHITQAGTSMGTPTYMSPEQAMGQETDARSDVYSLGIMLYELVVARPPFQVNSLTEAIRCHTKETPPSPRQFRPDLPQALEQVILKALAKEPRHRFESAAAMAQALNGTLGSATQIDAAPTAVQTNLSLLTQYQNSVAEERGPSIMGEFQTPIESGDTLQVRLPDGSIRNIPFIGKSMVIGRSDEADIVVNTGKVSRQHARIEYTGDEFRVTDLDSTNGTYLANARLLPGIPEAWRPDQPLRVGDVWLRLVRPAGAQSGTSPMGAGPSAAIPFSAVDPGMVRSSVGGDGRVGVAMQEQQLTVMPGASVSTEVVLLNQGTVVDHFTASVQGVPANWVTLPQTVQLLPGQQQVVTLTLHPPKEPKSRAGRYNLKLHVLSRDNPQQRVEVNFTLTVQAFSAFNSQVHPQKVSQNKPVTVSLVNQGNLPQTFNISSTDRADALSFTPPETQVTVPEGKTERITLKGMPKQRKFIGRPESVPFSVKVGTPDGQPQVHSGELVAKPILPIWLLSLAMLLAMIACVVGILFLTRPPVIESLVLDPTNPGAGEPVTIRWAVSNANRIELRPFGIEPDPGVGEYTFEDGFDKDTTITLIARSLTREVQENIQVNVTVTILDPVIVEWEVSPTDIIEGEEITITWNVENAETVTLRPFGTVNASGTMRDTPQTTKTYTLLATNQGKTVEKAQEVIVSPPPPDAPQVTVFTVEPGVAVVGVDATVKVSWEVENADNISIEPGIGAVGPVGSRDVPLPAEGITEFTLIAIGPEDQTTRKRELVVEPQQCLATTNDLNVRLGPGTVYEPEITKINTGDKVTPIAYSAIGYPDGKWVQVKIVNTGEEGWIHANFLDCNIDVTTLGPAASIEPTPMPEAEITNIAVSVTPQTYTGACPNKFEFKADITVASPGTITYKWVRSDGAGASEESLTFDAPGTKTVTSSWQLSAEGTRWKAIEILTPAPMMSDKAEFTLTCAETIAFVYSNQTHADTFETLLEDADYAVDKIKLSAVTSTDFSTYDMIIIGASTGSGADWGDNANSQRNKISAAGKPVLGLGRGGSAYFEDIGLDIGWMSTWTGSRKDVYVVDTNDALWNDPFDLTIPGNRILQLYSSEVGFVGVYVPGPIAGLDTLGRQHDNNEHFTIAQQNTRFLLWGYDGNPGDMTGTGKRVFINTVKQLLDSN